MNKFVYGFVVGVLSFLSVAIVFSIVFDSVPEENDVLIQTENSAKLALQHEAPILQTRKKSIQPDRTLSTYHIKETQNELEDTSDYIGDEDTIPNIENSKQQTKNQIVNKLEEFELGDLNRIKDILDNLNPKMPKEIFEEEFVDEEWSLKKQSELEYTFYDKSRLKDIGSLKSINCKSQYCRVRVQVAGDLEFNPSYVFDWSQPASVSIYPDRDDSSAKTIEIFIAREDKP